MLSLVYFLAHKGMPLSRAKAWSNSCPHSYNEPIVSQRISEFLRDVSEDERQRFLSMWLEHVFEGDYLCYDITSVSHPTQDTMNILIMVTTEIMSRLKQINLAMLFGPVEKMTVFGSKLEKLLIR